MAVKLSKLAQTFNEEIIMKKILYFSILTFFLLLNHSNLVAQNLYTSSNRLIHVLEAKSSKSGNISFYSYTDGYTALSFAFSDERFSILRNTIHVDFALTDHLTFALSPTLYKDLNGNKGESVNFPIDNVLISAKYGSLELSKNFSVGFLGSILVPATDRHNVYGQMYSGGGTELGLNVLSSYYFDQFFPNESLSIHFNIGYYMFNDKDQDISNNSREFLVSESSSAINYGLGFKYPLDLFEETGFDILLEYWGQMFMQEPPVIAYSREDISFITGAIKVTPGSLFSFSISGDLLITGDDDKTDYTIGRRYSVRSLPSASYPDYKIALGLQFNFNAEEQVPTLQQSATWPVVNQSEINLEQLFSDDQNADEKIEEIKRRRLQIEKNLQQLRQLLKENNSVPVEESE